MEIHEFDVEIQPGGKVLVHIKGVKGPLCSAYTKVFEEILGSAAQVEYTSEYYEPPTGVEIHIDQKLG